MSAFDIKNLIERAVKVREMSYSPYSHYKVGASLLSANGNIYVGCNFESAAFGAGVCAERVALGNAISNGEKDFIAICVSGNNSSITPCGVCRQALSEFGDIDVICCNDTGKDYVSYKLSDIFPKSFNSID